MSNNNSHRTSPRFSSPNTNHAMPDSNSNLKDSPTRMNGKRNKIYNSFQDSNCGSTTAAISYQKGLNNVNPENVQFYIQNLGLLCQNLEGRIQKLEHIFSEQLFGATRGIGCGGINTYTIYDSLIYNSTVDKAASATSAGGPYAFNPATIVPSSCGTSSSSTICSILEPIHKEMNVITKSNNNNLTHYFYVQKSDLDDYCLPLLQKRAAPSIGELNSIVMNLKKLKYPDLDNKFILSKVIIKLISIKK